MNDTKSAFSSLTIQACAVSAAAAGLNAFGVTADHQTITAIVAGVAALVGIYGRWRASTRIAKAA